MKTAKENRVPIVSCALLRFFPTGILAMNFIYNKSDKCFILISLYLYISHSDKKKSSVCFHIQNKENSFPEWSNGVDSRLYILNKKKQHSAALNNIMDLLTHMTKSNSGLGF